MDESIDSYEIARLKAEVENLRSRLIAANEFAELRDVFHMVLHDTAHSMHTLSALISALLELEVSRESNKHREIKAEMSDALKQLRRRLFVLEELTGFLSPLRSSQGDLRDLIEQAAETVFSHTNIKINIRWNSPHHMLLIDHRRMLAAFINVFLVARRAIARARTAESWRGAVLVDVEEVERHLEIVTSDTGIGNPEARELMFVRSVVEAHHGSVEISSQPEGGTMIVIRLPLTPVYDAP